MIPHLEIDLCAHAHSLPVKACLCSSTAAIDSPAFRLTLRSGTATLNVTDALTARFRDGRQQSVRDVFSDELHYRVTYWKNKSTGKVSTATTADLTAAALNTQTTRRAVIVLSSESAQVSDQLHTDPWA